MRPEEVTALYEEIRGRVTALGEEAIRRPRLATAAEVIAPLAPYHPDAIAAECARLPDADRRKALHGSLPEEDRPRHLAVQINRALTDLLLKYPESLIFGEDTAKKGGVYHVTADLQKKFGAERVFDTLLDEQTILGLAIGAAQAGQLPLPEIQYLAYFHNACDQIRGEACSLQYFSNDQFRNPMVVRVQGLAYQKGNKVTLSYRKDVFSRLKERNNQRIRECIKSGKLTVIFNSQPVEIREQSVVLQVQGGQREIPNDYVWVFAGGTPPNAFLEKIGVRLGQTDLAARARAESREVA